MHSVFYMTLAGRIDRTKHEVDITEQVSRGIRTEEPGGRAAVVDLGIRPWLAGHVLGAVQVHVLDRSSDEGD